MKKMLPSKSNPSPEKPAEGPPASMLCEQARAFFEAKQPVPERILTLIERRAAEYHAQADEEFHKHALFRADNELRRLLHKTMRRPGIVRLRIARAMDQSDPATVHIRPDEFMFPELIPHAPDILRAVGAVEAARRANESRAYVIAYALQLEKKVAAFREANRALRGSQSSNQSHEAHGTSTAGE